MREYFKNRYVKLAVALFGAGAALIVFYEVVGNLQGVSDAWNTISSILSVSYTHLDVYKRQILSIP